jgi:hypothetical protein
MTPIQTAQPANAPKIGVDPTKPPSLTQLAPAPFKIAPLRRTHKWLKGLFYGPYGSGKTSLVCSAVDVDEMNDVLMVDAESGTMSVENAEHIVNRDYIDRVRVTDFKTVALVQEFLNQHCIARDRNDLRTLKLLQARTFGHDPDVIDESFLDLDEYSTDDPEDPSRTVTRARLRRYKTAIIDSLAEVDTYSMYELLGLSTDMKLDEEMDVAEWAEFRKNNQKMQLVVRAYRDLPMHVLMVTGNKYTQDEVKRFHWTPTLTGQLANQVQGFVDVVGFLQNGKPSQDKPDIIPRFLWIQPIGTFDAKNRISQFKHPGINDPNMSKIMEIFRGGQIKVTSPTPKGTPPTAKKPG